MSSVLRIFADAWVCLIHYLRVKINYDQWTTVMVHKWKRSNEFSLSQIWFVCTPIRQLSYSDRFLKPYFSLLSSSSPFPWMSMVMNFSHRVQIQKLFKFCSALSKEFSALQMLRAIIRRKQVVKLQKHLQVDECMSAFEVVWWLPLKIRRRTND